MDQRQQRVVRGTLAAATAVFVAAWFHAASGGAAPSLLALIASFVLATPACVLLAGRRPRLWRLALSVGLSQFGFHLLFGLGQPSSVHFVGDAAMAGMPGMRLHAVGAVPASAGFVTSAMWAGHAVAAIVTVAALRRGESVLRGMLRLASRFMVRALELTAAPARRRLPAAAPDAAVAVLARRFLIGACRHRGPPAFALFSY